MLSCVVCARRSGNEQQQQQQQQQQLRQLPRRCVAVVVLQSITVANVLFRNCFLGAVAATSGFIVVFFELIVFFHYSLLLLAGRLGFCVHYGLGSDWGVRVISS